MEKIIKISAIVFAVIVILSVCVVSSLPKTRLTGEEKFKLGEFIGTLNDDLPRDIGTIGSLDSIRFYENTIVYFLTSYGDPEIIGFYQDHYDDFKNMALYSFASLNGQNENATKLAEYENQKGIKTQIAIYSTNRQSISWNFSASEILDFINNYNGTPTEAISSVLNFQIALENYKIQTITSNSTLSDDGFTFKSLSHNDNSIIMTYNVDENMYSFSDLAKNSKNPEAPTMIMSEMVKDKDAYELINLISISHSDIKLVYEGSLSHDMAEIVIPYSLIKQFSQVPNLHQ